MMTGRVYKITGIFTTVQEYETSINDFVTFWLLITGTNYPCSNKER